MKYTEMAPVGHRTYLAKCFESDGGCGREVEIVLREFADMPQMDCSVCGKPMRRAINQTLTGGLRALGTWYHNGNAKEKGY